jgi:hypothetical protein
MLLRKIKPCLLSRPDTDKMIEPLQVVRYTEYLEASVLSVAGPRESKFHEGHLSGSILFRYRGIY